MSTDTWDDSKLSSAQGYDANANGKVWVRAQTLVHRQKRAVAAMVVVQRPPVLPAGYSILDGAMSAQLSWAANPLLASSNLTPLTSGILGSKLVSGGKIGVRCGLTSLCVEGAFTALSASTLTSQLLANNTVQYGSPSAVNDDVITGLRVQAQTGTPNTLVLSVAANGNCIPAGATTSSIVFVEEVGDGRNDYCVVNTTTNPTVKMLVVANGRVKIQGTGTLTSVVYGLNRQRQALGDDRTARACAEPGEPRGRSV